MARMAWGLLLALCLALPAVAQGLPVPVPEAITPEALLASGMRNEARLRAAQSDDPTDITGIDHIKDLEAVPAIPQFPDGSTLAWTDLATKLKALQTGAATLSMPSATLAEVPQVWLQLRHALVGVAALVPEDNPDRRALIALLREEIESTRAFLEALETMQYPLPRSEARDLGGILDEYPQSFEEVIGEWRRMSQFDGLNVQSRMSDLIGRIFDTLGLPEHAAARQRYGHTLRWLVDTTNPPPSGKDNIQYYRKMIEDLLAVARSVEGTEAQLASLIEGVRRVIGDVLTPEANAALDRAIDPGSFREPLQVPEKIVAKNAKLIPDWLNRWLKGLGPTINPGSFGNLRWLLWVLEAVGISLLLWLIYLVVQARRGGEARRLREGAHSLESVIAGRRLQMEAQFAQALSAAAEGRLLEAWHWLAQGFIVGLAQRKLVRLDWSKTNREYVRELQITSAALYIIARRFFGTADRVVYGGQPTTAEEIRSFHDELLAAL